MQPGFSTGKYNLNNRKYTDDNRFDEKHKKDIVGTPREKKARKKN